MHHRAIALALCAALVFGGNAAAADKPLPETMKAIPAPYQSLKKNLDAKDSAAAAKDAQSLADLFKATDSVWAKAKFADAAKLAKEAQAAANQIVTAVKADKFDDTPAPYAVLVKSCASCHSVHREKLPDGTYKMK